MFQTSERPDFSTSPWCDTTLITPRIATKDLWNAAALERHGWATGNQKYTISAEDTLKETRESPDKNMRLAIAAQKDEVTKNLKMHVELSA